MFETAACISETEYKTQTSEAFMRWLIAQSLRTFGPQYLVFVGKWFHLYMYLCRSIRTKDQEWRTPNKSKNQEPTATSEDKERGPETKSGNKRPASRIRLYIEDKDLRRGAKTTKDKERLTKSFSEDQEELARKIDIELTRNKDLQRGSESKIEDRATRASTVNQGRSKWT